MAETTVPIQFPANLGEMLESFALSTEQNIGWCLLCNRPIHTVADLIPETNTHNCARGIELETQLTQQNS